MVAACGITNNKGVNIKILETLTTVLQDRHLDFSPGYCIEEQGLQVGELGEAEHHPIGEAGTALTLTEMILWINTGFSKVFSTTVVGVITPHEQKYAS